MEKVTANQRPTTHVFQKYGYGNMPMSTPPFSINGTGSFENVIGGVLVSSVLCRPILLCAYPCAGVRATCVGMHLSVPTRHNKCVGRGG